MNRLVGPNQDHTILVYIDKPFRSEHRAHIASLFDESRFDQNGSWAIKFYPDTDVGSVRYYEKHGEPPYFHPKDVPLATFLTYINHVQSLGYTIIKICGARINNEGRVILADNYKRGFKLAHHPTAFIA
jgi:hypothetical protein